jgi:tRNA G18 (ribose-2'-O)-methylase SpoU
MIKLNAKQLRDGTKYKVPSTRKKQEIYLILDDVLDTYNIGAIFRLAEATGVKRIYLCGGTETPPNPRIKKLSW